MSRINSFKMKELLEIYFIMGSPNCLLAPGKVLKKAIQGGITLFQFREKGQGALVNDEKYRLAVQLQNICREHHIPFIVNDDIELALDINADGVHIGQEDESASQVREKIGDKILGVSVHSLAEAEKAILDGADYLGLGPIFHTATKEDAKKVQGTQLIQLIREQKIEIPIVGIGGINMGNASEVIEAKADGISVISAISQATNITAITEELKRLVKKAKEK